ncbi:MAG: hypothetical protein HY717_09120 [Planctomycetes bacterium]|nr:hypothetical protein [Planctomycetota bacterium]
MPARNVSRCKFHFMGILAGAILLAALQGGTAWAQTTVVTKRASVTFSGELKLNFVYRNEGFFNSQKGEGEQDTPGVPSSGDTFIIEDGFSNADQVGAASGKAMDRDRDEFFIDPNLSLRFDITVQDNIKGVIELRTPWRNVDAGGKDASPGSSGGPDGGFFKGFKDRTLELKQAYGEADDPIWQGLVIRIGIQDFRKSLRGPGKDAYLIDVSGSENPFDGAIVPAALGDIIDDGTVNASGNVRGGGVLRTSTGFADSLEAAGVYVEQSFGTSTERQVPLLSFDGWAFIIDERFNVAPGPRDVYLWGFSTDIHLGGDGQLGKIFGTVFDLMNGGEANLFTAGGGVDLYPFPANADGVRWVELWSEAYGQGGDYARNGAVNIAGAPVNRDLDQKSAWMFEGGFQLNSNKLFEVKDAKFLPYLEASYVEVSGDHDMTDTNNQNFVSLENNNRTLVVEDGYYGFDIDTNYRGPRIAGGFHFGSVDFEILYAYLEWQDNGSGRISGGTTHSRKIGDELDFSLVYHVSTALEVGGRLGFLWDSRGLGQVHDTTVGLIQMLFKF